MDDAGKVKGISATIHTNPTTGIFSVASPKVAVAFKQQLNCTTVLGAPLEDYGGTRSVRNHTQTPIIVCIMIVIFYNFL